MTDVDMEGPEMETDDEMDSDDMGMGMDMDTDDEEEDMEEPIDLTDKSDEEVLRVFQLMGPDDNIIVTKDDAGNINIKDEENEYMIVGESDEEMEEEFYEGEEMEESMEMEEEAPLREELELNNSLMRLFEGMALNNGRRRENERRENEIFIAK
jgi:hypothetical protein